MRGNKVYVKDTTATEQKADAGESAGGGDGLIPAGFREVTVTTGVINADFVQITSGLNEGDEVYVDESASMRAESRHKAVRVQAVQVQVMPELEENNGKTYPNDRYSKRV